MSGPGSYDIGGILGEMREAYWAGVAEQEEAPGEVLEALLFTLGGLTCAFETRFAAEVLRLPKLIRLPAVTEPVVGIFNLRGEITAAMDVRPLLGFDAPPIDAKGRLVVVKGEAFVTALLIEGARGVHTLPMDAFRAAPGAAEERFIRGRFDHEGETVLLLDLPALLAAPEMLIGAEK